MSEKDTTSLERELERDPIGIRKRKLDDMENDIEETSQIRIVKIAKTSNDNDLSTVETEVSTPKGSMCPPDGKHLHDQPQYEISMASMRTIRGHLSEVMKKNQTIKTQMQGMREGVVNLLMAHMMMRQLAIEQSVRSSLDDDMRAFYLGVLETRKDYMWNKEKEWVNLEKVLGGYDATLELANAACVELDGMIISRMESLEAGGEWGHSETAMPHMMRLAKYSVTSKGVNAVGRPLKILVNTESQEEPPQPKGDFSLFTKLPVELRLQIWQSALPKRRVLTCNSHHNRHIAIRRVCHEAQQVFESHYTRILSPTNPYLRSPTPILHVSLERDIVIRDLTTGDSPTRSLFSLTSKAFAYSCHRMLSGLSRVKHIALAYDILRENGGTLFYSVQACCPELQTLVIFPNAQLISSTRQSNQNLNFIEVDSNLMDYIYFRLDKLVDRKTKDKAMRGVAVIAALLSHSLQYRAVFGEYLEDFGQGWNPVLRVCLLTRWNRRMRGWQTRSLVGLGDRCSKGFEGQDGRTYKGFVEADMVCGESGELWSRYDGMERLFGEDVCS